LSEAVTDDLAALLPGRDVVCNGETLRVVPLFFGQLPQAAKLARPLVMALAESGLFSVNGTEMSLAANWVTGLPMLFDQGGEAVMLFLAFAVGKPRKWFDTLPADEGLALATAVFEENRSFFVQKVLPMLKAAGLLVESKAPDGAPSSVDLSLPVTDGQTSNGTASIN
jgi:hypothetical protein